MNLFLKDIKTGEVLMVVDASVPKRVDLPDGTQVSPAEAGWSNEKYEFVEVVTPEGRVTQTEEEKPRAPLTSAQKVDRMLKMNGLTREEFLQEINK